jgi:ribosomal protein S27AE
MSTVTTWRTDEPCPACGTGLNVLDDGQALIRAVCGLCGYAEFWTGEDDTGGGQ